jgi:hypothetical protein
MSYKKSSLKLVEAPRTADVTEDQPIDFKGSIADALTMNARAYGAHDTQRAGESLAERKAELAIAQSTHDARTIAMCEKRSEEAHECARQHLSALPALIEQERVHVDAVAEFRHAQHAEAMGTLNADEAIARANAVVVTRARVIALETALPELREAVRTPLKRLAGIARIDTTPSQNLAASLLDEHKAAEAISFAREQGRKATPEIEAWWIFGEEVARRRFKEELRERKESFATRAPDWRREGPYLPSEQDLDAVFSSRRAGLEEARRALQSNIQQLQEKAAALAATAGVK